VTIEIGADTCIGIGACIVQEPTVVEEVSIVGVEPAD
jgi:ferredoxin